jgi:hypothetical protein
VSRGGDSDAPTERSVGLLRIEFSSSKSSGPERLLA